MKIKLTGSEWEGQTDIKNVVLDFFDLRYNHTEEDVQKVIDEEFKDIEWLFGHYDYECYSGDATVFFKRNGEYFEVGGGHCSCYGLEDQWTPEPSSREAIIARSEADNAYAKELAEFLKEVEL